MTDTPPEATPPEDTPQDTPEPEPHLFDAPADASDDTASGYAVYDRVLGRFVGGKTTDKPKASDAKAAAAGHTYKVVRV